jgi:uncharacterized protein (TIGR03663 family)
MATNTLPQQRPLLERSLDLGRVNFELLAYVLLIALSVIAHLWGLGVMAMHHDESVHAFPTWSLYMGRGGFTCANGEASSVYCYDPVYHGPTLYFFMLTSFFLFGDSELTARLPMAVAGILLVASAPLLRPYLGRRGALIAAVLLAFAPSLLYYTRFARHDALMLLWELWMVIGFLRFVDTGRGRWLSLLAAGAALAVATHEMYYILAFIFGLFVIIRALDESRFSQRLQLGMLIALGVCAVLMVINPPLPVGTGLFLGDKAMLLAACLLLGLLIRRAWSREPVLLPRLRALWQEDRTSLWVALAVFWGLYILFYSSFFAYPRGIVDGLYTGLTYWLGSQQAYARGDQPWYYYLMLLPIYEPLALTGSLATTIAVIASLWRRAPHPAPVTPLDDAPAPDGEVEAEAPAGKGRRAEGARDISIKELADAQPATPVPVVGAPAAVGALPLAPLLLIFWFFSSLVIFSWAGEKMPWLVVHIALPGNLLAAWGLGWLLRFVDERLAQLAPADDGPAWLRSPRTAVLLVPALAVLLLFTLGVALWKLFGAAPAAGQAAQSNALQGIIPLVVAGALLYALLTLAQRVGWRTVLAMAGITASALLGLYTVRATWQVVYDHPDTPIEPLVYVQTAPGIPLLASDIRELAINQTRNQRTAADPSGGLTMPILIDSGDPNASGEGSLAWPLQWYFRDFQRINWVGTDRFRDNASPEAFNVDNNGVSEAAPVVMLYKPHVTEAVRAALQASYVERYTQSKLNWWFPEGDKCAPDRPGYKRFYFSSSTSVERLASEPPKGCGANGRTPSEFFAPWAPLTYPFWPQNWGTMGRYLLYRELPADLTLSARDMEVWVRKDLAPAGGSASGTVAGPGLATLRLVASQSFGDGEGEGLLNQPTGAAVDAQGNVYVADTQNHRIAVFDAQGGFVRAIGSKGAGEGQFFEPRGVAIAADGSIYVADTWNARIVKLSPDGSFVKAWGSGAEDLGEGRRATMTQGTAEGNAANPLGFFGPRGIALDGKGSVFIADTGNKRIVVTDTEGNFKYQWGTAGPDVGAFNEPTAVGVDAQGNVYVADTWNGRVQVFPPDANGQTAPVPSATWQVDAWRPNTYDDPSLAVSGDGRVYVSTPTLNSVLLANARGDVGLRWGGPGEDLASLNAPTGIAVGPDGAVYVVDRTSGRVLRFALPQIQLGQ